MVNNPAFFRTAARAGFLSVSYSLDFAPIVLGSGPNDGSRDERLRLRTAPRPRAQRRAPRGPPPRSDPPRGGRPRYSAGFLALGLMLGGLALWAFTGFSKFRGENPALDPTAQRREVTPAAPPDADEQEAVSLFERAK